MYTTQPRKPMMYGGMATTQRPKKAHGGKHRKKYANGKTVTNMEKEAAKPSSQTTVTDKAKAMSAKERESLIKEQIRLENLQDENAATPQQMERLMVIYDKLGISATPGRANVDR